MIKDVEINGRKYEVDTTPHTFGHKAQYATVHGISESPTSGVLANFLREVGKEPVTRVLTEISEDEEKQVVLSLGYRFSKSNAWKNLFQLHYTRKRYADLQTKT